MRRLEVTHVVARIAMVAALAIFGGIPAHAADDLDSLNSQVVRLYRDGKSAEATAIAEKALALAEHTMGPSHPKTLRSVNNLAALYRAQGRLAEAEPLLERALAGYEATLGMAHPNTLTGVNNLAELYQAQGRLAEAEPLLKRALAGNEAALGAAHEDTLLSVNNLAALYQAQGRLAEAEPLFKQALAGREAALGASHPDTLMSVNNLAVAFQAQGRYAEAEPLLKRVLAGNEATLGAAHPDTLLSVNNLAALYDTQGRYAEAEPLYKRALGARDAALGPAHPDTLLSVNNLAALYWAQGRYTEAEPLFKRALVSRETALGASHPETLTSVNNLGLLHQRQGRPAEAEALYKRALAGYEAALGASHPHTLTSVNNLARLYQSQGRRAQAEPLLARALTNFEQALGPEHPDTLSVTNNLAALHFEQADWPGAAQLWRRSTAAIAARVQRGTLGTERTGKQRSEAERSDWQFRALVRTVYRLATAGREPDMAAAGEMFQTAQWALGSEAAQSLAQMAARGASGDPALAAVVRERQDLVDEWQRREQIQAVALGQVMTKRDASAEAESGKRMATIDKRITEIDRQLKTAFPDYAALASTAPLSVRDAQAQIDADEALILFLDTPEWLSSPEETFIWIVTRTQMRWVRSDLGSAALAREVQALRCGLDAAAWTTGSRCPELTGQPAPGRLLPFDHARAHRLYKELFGKAEELIKGKHLLIVPSGALTQLPFGVLVTAPPANGDHKSVSWLARDHAITVLPAVSSLQALRATGRPSRATKPLIGFGNPLLDGPDARYAQLARLARERQSCAKTTMQRMAELFGLRGATALDLKSGRANLSLIRRQAPLPETADELCAVALGVGADESELRLGAKATEREVKAMSAGGKLAEYRIVHFATHGAMAGELQGSIEPGLILTPPAAASEEDDGYLSASEIAALKLDAEWVILSACNTAAGNAQSAEALSGLARAFIYAQARALLVSHWAVDSDAAVRLITSAMGEIARDKAAGLAEATRRAMLTLIDKGEARQAHPSFWAPFIVVGEGGR